MKIKRYLWGFGGGGHGFYTADEHAHALASTSGLCEVKCWRGSDLEMETCLGADMDFVNRLTCHPSHISHSVNSLSLPNFYTQ